MAENPNSKRGESWVGMTAENLNGKGGESRVGMMAESLNGKRSEDWAGMMAENPNGKKGENEVGMMAANLKSENQACMMVEVVADMLADVLDCKSAEKSWRCSLGCHICCCNHRIGHHHTAYHNRSHLLPTTIYCQILLAVLVAIKSTYLDI